MLQQTSDTWYSFDIQTCLMGMSTLFIFYTVWFWFTSLIWTITCRVLNVHMDQSSSFKLTMLGSKLYWKLLVFCLQYDTSTEHFFCLFLLLFFSLLQSLEVQGQEELDRGSIQRWSRIQWLCLEFSFIFWIYEELFNLMAHGIRTSCSWQDSNLMMGDFFHGSPYLHLIYINHYQTWNICNSSF